MANNSDIVTTAAAKNLRAVHFESMGKALPIIYGTHITPGVVVMAKEQTSGGSIYLPRAAYLDFVKQTNANATLATDDAWIDTDQINGSQGTVAAEIALCAGPIAGILQSWRGDDFIPVDLMGTWAPQPGLEAYNNVPELVPGSTDQTVYWVYDWHVSGAPGWKTGQAYWNFLDRYTPELRCPLARTAYLRCASWGLPDNSKWPDFKFEVRGLFPGRNASEVLSHTWQQTGQHTWGNPLAHFYGPGSVSQTITIATPGVYRFSFFKGTSVFTDPLDQGRTPPGRFGVEATIATAGGTNLLHEVVTEFDQYNYDVCFDSPGAYTVTVAYFTDTPTTWAHNIYWGRPSLVPLDVNAADVLVDLLTNDVYGLGININNVDVDHASDNTANASYRRYCLAMDFMVSGIIDQQTTAIEAVQNLLDSTNAVGVWSGGKLKILPRGDVSVSKYGYTYSPATDTVALGNNDFIIKNQGDDPVDVVRRSPADCFNVCPVTYPDRSKNYTGTSVSVPDTASIDSEGRKTAEPFESKWIVSQAHAQAISQMLAKRSAYIKNTYHFFLSWKYAALEPGDLVILTEEKLGLSSKWARIVTVEEGSDGTLEVWAEEYLGGVAHTGPLFVKPGKNNDSPYRPITGKYTGLFATVNGNSALGLIKGVQLDVDQRVKIDLTNLPDGTIIGPKIKPGTITDNLISGISGSKITGMVGAADVANSCNTASYLAATGTIGPSQINGTIPDSKIGGMSATKLIGNILDSQINGLSTSKLSGYVLNSQIDTVAADKLTGIIGLDKLPAIPSVNLTSGALGGLGRVPFNGDFEDCAPNGVGPYLWTFYNSKGYTFKDCMTMDTTIVRSGSASVKFVKDAGGGVERKLTSATFAARRNSSGVSTLRLSLRRDTGYTNPFTIRFNEYTASGTVTTTTWNHACSGDPENTWVDLAFDVTLQSSTVNLSVELSDGAYNAGVWVDAVDVAPKDASGTATDADTLDGQHGSYYTNPANTVQTPSYRFATDTEKSTWNGKLDSSHAGTGGSAHAVVIANGAAGFMTGADKAKLDGVAAGATNYTHPANHPPSIITQDASNRFATDAEKATWNGKLDASHAGTGGAAHAVVIASGAAGFMTGADKAKLDGIAAGATNYTHPANHPPSIITQDASNRFVTDAEKSNWNGKQSALGFTPANKAGDTFTGQTAINTGYASGNAYTLGVQGHQLTIGDPLANLDFPGGLGIKFQNTGVAHASLIFDSPFIKMGLSSGVTGLTLDNPASPAFQVNLATGAAWLNSNAIWHAGNLAFGTGATDMAAGNHTHSGIYEPAFTKNTAFNKNFGTTSGTVCDGADSRLTNARTPTAHAATHQPGGSDAMAVDAAAGTGSLRTLGSGATQAAAGNHAHSKVFFVSSGGAASGSSYDGSGTLNVDYSTVGAAASGHLHAGIYEPVISTKKTAFNVDFGTALGTAAQGNHTHGNAVASGAAGFMTGADKAKLDGIAANANNYSLPTASATVLGGIKVGSGLAIDGSGVLSATGGGSTGSWQNVSFDNDWCNYSDWMGYGYRNVAPVQCCLDAAGFVHLRGAASNDNGGKGDPDTAVCWLPYGPEFEQIYTTIGQNNQVYMIRVCPDCSVRIGDTFVKDWFSLDGITFRVA